MTELLAILRHINEVRDGSPGVLATLVRTAGSSYRRAGARLLLSENGRRIGSISGGCLEEDVVARAERVAKTGQPELATYDTTEENDLVWGVGLGCHGVVDILLEKLSTAPLWARRVDENIQAHRPTPLSVVWRSIDGTGLGTRLADEARPAAGVERFMEVVQPPPRLVVFGAGDDARPLVRMAKTLGWHVTVADPRPDYGSTARFPEADRVVVAAAGELVARAAVPPDGLAVVMTHHYIHDVPILAELMTGNLRYVGLLGPKRRASRILEDLGRRGVTVPADQAARLHAPVGLDLGAETPEEVALSVVAEISSVLRDRDARPLRLRSGPIHA